MNSTTKGTNFQPVENSSGVVQKKLTSPFINKAFVRDDCFKVEHRGGGVETVP